MQSFMDIHRMAKKFKVPGLCVSAEDKQKPSCFSFHDLSKSPFHGLFSAMFPTFLGFRLVILLLKIRPPHCAEVLVSVLAVSQNESTTYITLPLTETCIKCSCALIS